MPLKLTMVPLETLLSELRAHLPIDLSYGLSIKDLKPQISGIILDLWKLFLSPELMAEVRSWSVCLVHQFEGEIGMGEADASSQKLLRYATAHLRLLAPDSALQDHR